MSDLVKLSLAAALACSALVTAADTKSPSQPLNYAVFPEYERNLPGKTISSSSSAHVFGARGEYMAFQISVTTAGATLLDVTASPLSDGRKHEIPPSNITIYREHYVNVSPASPDRNGTNRSQGAGLYPDALIPFRNPKTGRMPEGAYRAAPFRIDGKQLLTLWIDVSVPRNAVQGEYRGDITLSSDKGKVSVPVTVTVWDFALPVKPSLQSSFAYWNAGGQDEIEELLRHKLMPQHGAGKQAGAAVERRLASSAGLKMSDTGFWSGADNSHCSMKPAPSVKDLLASVAGHDPGLSLFNYTADEVGNCKALYPQIQAWGRNLHAAKIKNLVVMAPTPELLDAVDIWVMLPVQFEHPSPALAAARARGSEIWSYNALVQDSYSPKWLIDYDPIGYRLQAGFLSQTLNLTGLLYWRIDRWDGDPWKNVNNTGVFSSGNYPGDGMLVYPGAPAGVPGVVPSMRLKQLREGVQDYEYVEILKHLGRGAWALDKIRSVAPDWTKWTRKGADLEAVRQQLAAEIQRLSR